MRNGNKNIKIFLNYFLGPLLFIWLSFSLYHQVKNQPNLNTSLHSIVNAIKADGAWKLITIIFLMLINWGLEAAKWKLLMSALENVSWLKSIQAILAGVAFAVNTPNRIGEYGGRVLYVKEGHRISAVSLTVAGSFSQLIITLLMGCFGIAYLLKVLPGVTVHAPSLSYFFWMRLLLYVVMVIVVLCLLLYFRLAWLVKMAEKIPGSKKYLQHLHVLELLSVRGLLRVFCISALRYAVFVLQYILMLQLMQVHVTAWQSIWLVSVMFLVMAVVPSIALAELGLRGRVSIELFGWFSNNTAGIIAGSISMWLINLLLPALIGSLCILGVKFFEGK
jgi:Lysylphosphatidylglycerol synthase TM region